MSFNSDKFNESFHLEEGIDNKTLKEYLYNFANVLDLPLIGDKDSYHVHHYDHNVENNDPFNIYLVNSSQHLSYHKTVRDRNLGPGEERDKLFLERCTDNVNIGKKLSEIFKLLNTPSIKDDDKNINK